MTHDGMYRAYNNEAYSQTPTPQRRRMPQIPTKRSASRQSSFNDDSYDGYRTPENSSHRGASLPPTPTKTPKILARLAAHNKPFNSLPPTPGRQLPKPNVNHRSAKARRNSIMKRTNSAEYTDNVGDAYDNYYMRPGAVSAREMYNEDYNYAYQSNDNLEQEETITPVQNVSVNVVNQESFGAELNSQQIGSQYQQYSSDEYYYSAQESTTQYVEPDYYIDNTQVSQRRKLLSKRDNSPLLQQNTDSLESRDDDLKDSFDTAVSSISSSLYQHKRNAYPDYSAPDDNTSTITSTMHVDDLTKTITTVATTVTTTTTIIQSQYNRDQIDSPQAVDTQLANHTINVAPSQINNTQTVPIKNTNTVRGYLQQQETIDNTYYQHLEPEIIYETEEYSEKGSEHYLDNHESIDSYTEENGYSNDVNGDFNNKAINRDSPASVIHVERYDDEQSLRRGSSQITVVDPYHPSLQRQNVDNYNNTSSSRRASLELYRAQSPSRLVQNDVYQTLPTNDDYELTPARKPSVIDTYQTIPNRRTSIRHTTNEHQDSLNHHEVSNEEDLTEKKSVSFEEEEDKAPRPKITAQQRWLWAYNKIIMQLNVSLSLRLFIIFILMGKRYEKKRLLLDSSFKL